MANVMPSSLSHAATLCQSQFRGFFSRKKFQLQPIEQKNRTQYSTNVKGNDPEITSLPSHPPTDKILLIATSGMRCVELACQLSGTIPKIILIDNSQAVISYWQRIKHLIATNHTSHDFVYALKNETNFCVNVEHVIEFHFRYKNLSRDIQYYQKLFLDYSYERVKQVIIGTTVLPQSWADRATFIKIKNIYTYLHYDALYVYPSNIVAYLYQNNQIHDAEAVLDNIELLQPNLAIHTDLSPLDDSSCCVAPHKIIVGSRGDDKHTLLEALGIDVSHPPVVHTPHIFNQGF